MKIIIIVSVVVLLLIGAMLWVLVKSSSDYEKQLSNKINKKGSDEE